MLLRVEDRAVSGRPLDRGESAAASSPTRIFGSIPRNPSQRALITHGHSDHARGGHWRRAGHARGTGDHGVALWRGLHLIAAGGRARLAYGEIGSASVISRSFRAGGPCTGIGPDLVVEGNGLPQVVVSGRRLHARRRDPTCLPVSSLFPAISSSPRPLSAPAGLPAIPPSPTPRYDRLLAARARHSRAVRIRRYLCARQGTARDHGAAPRAARHQLNLCPWRALQRLCDLYRQFGLDLGDLPSVTGLPPAALKGAIILARHPRSTTAGHAGCPIRSAAMASGWMRVRQRRMQHVSSCRSSSPTMPIGTSSPATAPPRSLARNLGDAWPRALVHLVRERA